MRFVPVKGKLEPSTSMVHKARHGLVAARTAGINRIRGLLCKLGIVPPLKAEFSGRMVLQA